MKKQLLLLVMVLLPLAANAYDAVIDGICYIFNKQTKTATVTFKYYKSSTYSSYSGTIVIPSEVIHNNTKYRVTTIGEYAFYNCFNLNSVTIPNSVLSIGDYAFYSTQLKTLIVGAGLMSISNNAFSTEPVKTIWLTNTPPVNYELANGTVNYSSNTQHSGLNNLKVYEFLSSMFDVDGIKYVPVSPSNHTCDAIDCVYDKSFQEININSTVFYKGIEMKVLNVMPYSMYKNDNLLKINIDFAGKIGRCAFNDCKNLQIAVLGDKITSIDEYAFCGCSKLEGIFVPDSVSSIGQYAFSDCSSMKTVSIGNGTNIIDKYAFFGCSKLKSASIGNGTNLIGQYAFSNCSELPQINISKSVKYVDNYSFSGCKSLKKVIMDDRKDSIKVTSYDNWDVKKTTSRLYHVNTGDILSFNCSIWDGKLSIDIPSEGIYDVENGNYLKTFAYPGVVTIKFSPGMYGNCKITDMKLIENGNLTFGSNGSSPLFIDCPLDSIYIGRNISYNKNSNYGYSPFYRNTSLRSVVITDKEEEISENEFYGCTNMKNVQIGDGVTMIGNWAFSGCASLQHFAFGSQVKTIGKEAFSDCTAVTSIISKAQTPPTCGSQALDDINKWTCMLTVPQGCKESYAAADQWKEFFFVEEGDGSGQQNSDTPETKKCVTPTISYSNGKLMFNCGTEGAICMSTIKDVDITSYTTNEVDLSVTYTVSVYATLAGYEDSDIATATLCWIDQQPATEGVVDGIANVPAKAVLIQSNGGQLTIEGANDGEYISVYNINGTQEGSAISNDGSAVINANLQPGNIAIVKIGDKSIKIIIK